MPISSTRVAFRYLQSKETSPTQEGAKSLFERYREKHPGTKKKVQDFFEAPEKKEEPKQEKWFSDSDIAKLPWYSRQPTSDPDKLFEMAEEAHKQQLEWLDQGQGIDKVLGAKTVRCDKGDCKIDYDKPGPVVLIGPPKQKARSQEKVEAQFGGDWGSLTDIVRASIAVDSMDQVQETLSILRQSGIQLARRPKDRFRNPTEAGYRDFSLDVVYPNGMVGELQLHVKSILKAKDEGHKYYETVRSFAAKAEKEGRTIMTDEEQRIVDEANQKMRDLYDEAWQRALGHKKAAAEKIKYFDYESIPAKWEKGKFPTITVKGKEKAFYDLEDFFQKASPIKEKQYEDMVENKGTKKQALNKYDPGALLQQLVTILEQFKLRQEAKKIRDLTPAIQKAWSKRDTSLEGQSRADSKSR